MKYYSTNKQAPDASLEEAVVKGLAADKGLFMPYSIKPLPQEFYDSIDENYENVSSRMMGNQKLVEKFVRKFLEDPTYKQIKESVEKMDYDEILRATHTMKGIASNLEFTQLQQKSAKAVDMIRAGEKETVLPVIDEIEKEYQKVVDAIQKLD